jgi:hypothetical protein
MPKESFPSEQVSPEKKKVQDIDVTNVELLSPQTKMRYVLEVFDLGSEPDKNEERRRKFIDLIGAYHTTLMRSRTLENNKNISESDANRGQIHNQIMAIFRDISMARNIGENRRKFFEYLSKNRKEVEKMIRAYFSPNKGASNESMSEYQMIQENPMYFGKDEE